MMMSSTMILTICISMMLKRNRGLSLDIGSRYERTEHKTHNSNHKSHPTTSFLATKCNMLFGLQNWNEKYRTLISSARYVALAGSGLEGRSRPPRQNFSVTSVGSSSTSGGLNHSHPRQIERSLVGRLFHARATVTRNDRLPMVLSRVRGTIRRGQEPDRSQYRDSASSVQWGSSVIRRHLVVMTAESKYGKSKLDSFRNQ